MAGTPKRFPTTDELDYKRRQEEGDPTPPARLVGGVTAVHSPYAVNGNDTSAYVGVSPEYMTYANETEKPLRAASGVEKEREDAALADVPVVAQAAVSKLDGNHATQGGGSSTDLVYTQHSGEDFTAKEAEVKGSDETAEVPATPPPPAK